MSVAPEVIKKIEDGYVTLQVKVFVVIFNFLYINEVFKNVLETFIKFINFVLNITELLFYLKIGNFLLLIITL
uniref:Uncharacterized protein n=1 Tax=Heterorhabditis bacteriophora TaxID=37862 RepID=A0A1I7WTM8_HETBA